MKKIDLIAEVTLRFHFFGTGMTVDYSNSSDLAEIRSVEPAVPPPQRA
jgi:hypothetical protein